MLQTKSEFASNQKQNFKSSDERQQKFDKIKMYVVDENEENESFEKEFQNQQNDDNNYYIFENLNYYEFQSYNESKHDDEVIIYLIMSKIITFVFAHCRKCNQIFIFNNKLHQHVRKAHRSKVVISSIVLLTKFNLKKSFDSNETKLRKSFDLSKTKLKKFFFFIFITKDSSIEKSFTNIISIINFDVDYNKNVNINYDFRD